MYGPWLGGSNAHIFSGGQSELVLGAGQVGRTPSPQMNLGPLFSTDFGEGK